MASKSAIVGSDGTRLFGAINQFDEGGIFGCAKQRCQTEPLGKLRLGQGMGFVKSIQWVLLWSSF